MAKFISFHCMFDSHSDCRYEYDDEDGLTTCKCECHKQEIEYVLTDQPSESPESVSVETPEAISPNGST